MGYQMDWKIKQRTRTYDGHFKVDQLIVQHELFAGGVSAELKRERVTRQNSVAVLPYDPVRDEVVLIEQFRVGPLEQTSNPWLVEVIAGLVEEGESLEEVAYREAVEEANCKIEKLHLISSFFSSPGGFAELAHVYIGKTHTTNLGGIHGAGYEGEDIRVKVVSSAQAFELLHNGIIRSAIPMIALYGFKDLKAELQRKWIG